MADAKLKPPFGLPETVDNRGVYLAERTHRLPDGRFEACAAIFAWGRRGLTIYAVAATRSRALREAVRATETGSNYRRALAEGRISHSPFSAKATGSAA